MLRVCDREDAPETGAAEVWLRLWQEECGETLVLMQAENPDKDGCYTEYSAEITLPDVPGLLWYHFRIVSASGRWMYYGSDGRNLGGVGRLYDAEPPSWQITVYRRHETPEWLRRGVCYQIFPDRFAQGDDWRECQRRAELPEDWRGSSRVIQQNWYDTPFYGRNSKGDVVRWPFFGGNLRGIRSRLLYLKSLGVTTIYLNPIFLATSNHKYDTADYLHIDPAFGDEAEFARLCAEAGRLGIRLILDGVFSHTGADSIYFDKYGNFGKISGDVGAYQSSESPYRKWYRFKTNGRSSKVSHRIDRQVEAMEYACWWGVDALPEVDESQPDYQQLIFGGENSVVRRWLRAGAAGWRLDVADELPDEFIFGLCEAAREEKNDAVIIGEVWEDATNKQSYGRMRRYLLGDSEKNRNSDKNSDKNFEKKSENMLDGVMGYPFRTAALRFLLGRIPAAELAARLNSLLENYPPYAVAASLNLIGTHDTVRVLTALADVAEPGDGLLAAEYRLPPEEREAAAARLRLLSALQFVMPGVPEVYYGDEAGVEGFRDPLNRGTYPWGREDNSLLGWYRRLAMLRQEYPLLIYGDCRLMAAEYDNQNNQDVIICRRFAGENSDNNIGNNKNTGNNKEEIWLVINRSGESRKMRLLLDGNGRRYRYARELFSGREVTVESGVENGNMLETEIAGVAAELWLLREDAPPRSALVRSAGVLCHVTSLPSINKETDKNSSGWEAAARRFVDVLADGGQKLWQILPLCPVGESLSPYSPLSVFAGHEGLAAGLLSESVEFSDENDAAEYRRFCRENSDWLDDYALYCVLREKNGGKPWQEWPEAERDRHDVPGLLRRHAVAVEECRRRQFAFRRAWRGVRDYANSRGVSIIGDMPIYTALDSADTWAHRELFLLDEAGRPIAGAGVPPDDFAAEGQNWGNPLYDWEKMREDDYGWWTRRIELAIEDYDFVRLDHFRAMAAFFAVPAGGVPGDGYWLKGPGQQFFNIIQKKIQEKSGKKVVLPLLAEDLGTLDEDVHTLLRLTGYPGMAVWQFEPDRALDDEAWLGGRVLYSGTHDNQTLVGWLGENRSETDGGSQAAAAAVIERLYGSAALWVIVPMQDVLLLGDEARMNIPGEPDGNWRWRFEWEAVTPEVIGRLRYLSEKYGRAF